MTVYNKLVRDRIPERIRESGKSCTVTILEQEAYIAELRKKLREETDEYARSESDSEALEELADILELLHALSRVHKGSPEQLEQIRAQKAEERGGFEKAVFLGEVSD